MPELKRYKDAHAFLKKFPVGVLATVDPNDEPHAAVIYFAVDSSMNIFFLTKTGTKKADNLHHKPHVMLVSYEAATQTTVQITGEVTPIENEAEKNAIFGKIMDASYHLSGTNVAPISKLKEGEYIAFQLTPKQIRMAQYGRAKGGEYDDIFKTTEPDTK